MNLLKKLWNSLVSKTSTSPKLVVAKDDSKLLEEMLGEILVPLGVRPSEIRNLGIVDKFDAWYDGPCTKEAVSASIDDFKKAYGIRWGNE